MDQPVLCPTKQPRNKWNFAIIINLVTQRWRRINPCRQTFKREVTTDDIIWVTISWWWSCVTVSLLLKLSELLLEISHMFLQFSGFSLQNSWCEMADKHMIRIWGSCCEIHATPSWITFFGDINLYQKFFCFTSTFPCTAQCFMYIIYSNDIHRDQWIKTDGVVYAIKQVANGKATSHQQGFIYTWKGRSNSSILVRACKLSLTTLNISSDIDWNSWEHSVLSKKLCKTWIRA